MIQEKTKLKRGHNRSDGMILWASAKGYETWVSLTEFLAKKEKARIAMIEWRKINPLKAGQWAKKWRENNPEKAKESCAKWARQNSEKIKVKQALWTSRNPDKVKKLAREKYLKQKLRNLDALRAKSRLSASKWRANNPELSKQRARKWQIENAAKTVAYTQKREAQKRASIPADSRDGIVSGLYVIAERISRCTGIQHEVDHVWPLSKGGSHCHRNLQVIPAALNRRKSARLDFDLPSCYQSEGWRVQKPSTSP